MFLLCSPCNLLINHHMYSVGQKKEIFMTYIAKPKLANNIGVKEFKTAAEAIVYLATEGVETHGVNEAEKVEELGWIGKLEIAA